MSTAIVDEFHQIANVEKTVSRLILGSVVFSPPNKDFAYSMLDEFVRLGGTALETAHSYGDGDCERMIGKWLVERNLRDKIVVITKGGNPFDFRSRVLPECIDAELHESLARLQTDYVDIYLLHRDDPSRPVSEIVDCLSEHHKAGRVRAYGGSNWSPARIEEANEYAKKNNLPPFAVSSPHFSLAIPHRTPWTGCIWLNEQDKQWYRDNDMPIVSWSSLARGFFAQSDSARDYAQDAWHNPKNFERLERAKELGEKRGFSANAVALAYVLKQNFKVFAAVGPANIEELHDSFSALSCDLTEDEARWLNLEE